MNSQRTFIMLKPSAVSRGLVGEIISRFERKGLRILQLKVVKMKRELVEELYRIHFGKPFYENLVTSLTGKTVIVFVAEGREAISVARKLIGSTDPVKAEPGTIRGDFGLDLTDNIIHASDSLESYEREYKIFFTDEELKTFE